MKIEVDLSPFYSPGDERRFFSALAEIDCITNIEGIGRGIRFEIHLARFSRENALELIALLYRYQIELTPLRLLAEGNKEFSWLLESKFYWHDQICKSAGA